MDFSVPLRLNTKNQALLYGAPKFFKISSSGRFFLNTRKRIIKGTRQGVKLGRRSIKVVCPIETAKPRIVVSIPNKKDSHEEMLVTAFLRSMLGIDKEEISRCKYKIGYTGNNPSNISSASVTINGNSIRKACEYRYYNAGKETEFEKKMYSAWINIITNLGKRFKFYKKYQCESLEDKNAPPSVRKIRNQIIRDLKAPRLSLISQKFFPSYVNQSFYLLDFYLPCVQIGFEVDGLHHFKNKKQVHHDNIRTAELDRMYNVDLVRFPNPLVREKGGFGDLIDTVFNLVMLKVGMISYKGAAKKARNDHSSKSKFGRISEQYARQLAAKIAEVNQKFCGKYYKYPAVVLND